MVRAIETDRLTLRRWRESDRGAFHLLNSDPLVMDTIGEPMSRAQSDAFMNRIESRHDECGFGLWCLDFDGDAIGFTGFMAPWFREGVEIGWRIRSEYWGQGLAPEAARACLHDGFDRIGFDEVISFTALVNHKSQRVMDKIGLRRVEGGDFDHPSFTSAHRLRRHALYRLTRHDFETGRVIETNQQVSGRAQNAQRDIVDGPIRSRS